MPTLDALFEMVRASGQAKVRFNIETKISPLTPELAPEPEALARMPERVKYEWLPRLGLTAFPRDLGAIHRRLVADGRAVFAGAPLTQSHVDVEDDLERVARAIVAGVRTRS